MCKSAVWIGKMSSMWEHGILEQEVLHRSGKKTLTSKRSPIILMSQIVCTNEQRIDLKNEEFNSVRRW